MSHRSHETEARVAKKQADQVLRAVAQKQDDLVARRDGDRQYALSTLRAEHLDRDEYALRLLEQPEVLESLGILAEDRGPEEFTARLLDVARGLARETSKRDVVELIAEKKRIGDSVPSALVLVAKRLGLEVEEPAVIIPPAPPALAVVGADGAAPG